MNQAIATLGEGTTPLVRSHRIGPESGSPKLHFKLESCNPSGSYKDRFIAREITAIREGRAAGCVATSSGNTGSSLAAYCARYALRCVILVNHDAPAGKLAQMQAHGATVLRVCGFVSNPAVTEKVFSSLRIFSESRNVPLVVSAYRFCPAGMAGVQTIALELTAQLAETPAVHVFVPVGGGGLYASIVLGFQNCGGSVPRVHAVQPAGCSTVAASFLRGDDQIRPVMSTTRVSGLSVPYDIDASLALHYLKECGGSAFEVEDEEVFEAQQMLMSREGIYCEPAAAAALAGWRQARKSGLVADSETSVCLVTGHGFKDPASVEAAARRHPSLSVHPGELDSLLPRLVERDLC
jgi:threonine synthase